MQNRLLMVVLCSTFILGGCKDEVSAPATNSNSYTTKQIFVEPWGAADANTKVTGLAYDSTNDQLFWIKYRWQHNNEIMRYNITKAQYDYVYSYHSQWDAGLRIIGNDLWIVRSYDTSIVKLSSLSNYPISFQNLYTPRGSQPSLHNISDIAIVGGDIYFVTGNFVVWSTYNGLQCSRGPNFTGVEHITQEVWPQRDHSDCRSIVAVGNNLAIATGDSGAIELRTLSGNLINSQAGYGNSYLQIDSRNRIYSTAISSSPLIKIIRWSADLSSKEEFSIITVPDLFQSYRPLFVIREKRTDSIDVIMTKNESNTSPVFQMATLPK